MPGFGAVGVDRAIGFFSGFAVQGAIGIVGNDCWLMIVPVLGDRLCYRYGAFGLTCAASAFKQECL